MQSFAASPEEKKIALIHIFEISSKKVSFNTESIPNRRCFFEILQLDLALEADSLNIPVHPEWGYTQSN